MGPGETYPLDDCRQNIIFSLLLKTWHIVFRCTAPESCFEHHSLKAVTLSLNLAAPAPVGLCWNSDFSNSLIDWQPKQQNKHHTSPGLCEYDFSVVIIVFTECVHCTEAAHKCVFLDGQRTLASVWLTLTLPFPVCGPPELVHIAEDFSTSRASFPSPLNYQFPLVQLCISYAVRLLPSGAWTIVARWHERSPGILFLLLVPKDQTLILEVCLEGIVCGSSEVGQWKIELWWWFLTRMCSLKTFQKGVGDMAQR